MMATEPVTHLLDEGQFEDAVVVAAIELVKRGSAYTGLLRRDIVSKYNGASEMELATKDYSDQLYQASLRISLPPKPSASENKTGNYKRFRGVIEDEQI